MFSNQVLPISSNEVFEKNQAPTLSYMLFVHRNELRSRDKRFAQNLILAQSKMYITDTLISEAKRHLHHQRGLDDLGILNREQLFCNRLKTKVKHMLTWKEMTTEERMEIKVRADAIRKLMESQGNEEGNCPQRQKLDNGNESL